MFDRASGLLLPIASLPRGGADDFLRFLELAGQRWWQVLPIHPPGYGGSPYAALSAFAGDEEIFGDGPVEDRPVASWLDTYARFRDRENPRAWIERQWRFDDEWAALKRRANNAGISLMGDLPLFVARDSADVWGEPALFDKRRVAGVPPDYFNSDGQLWGNPQYDWAEHKRTKFAWWRSRVNRQFELFDAVRIDHFLGLHRAWSIPRRAKSAKSGEWRAVPGDALLKALGPRKFVAENLGVITPEAEALREKHQFPGMHVLHFSFGEERPFWFDANNVVYTGTHDNDTTRGWSHEPAAAVAAKYLGCTRTELPGKLLRLAWLSRPDLAIAPVQDVLQLGSRARLNRPGTADGNWKWKLRKGQLTKKHARELRALTKDAGR